jgi:hypothetical protein
MARKKPNNLTETTNTINAYNGAPNALCVDKDLVIAIIIGIIGSLVALAMFFLSGYMVTQSALGAPLYALMYYFN